MHHNLVLAETGTLIEAIIHSPEGPLRWVHHKGGHPARGLEKVQSTPVDRVVLRSWLAVIMLSYGRCVVTLLCGAAVTSLLEFADIRLTDAGTAMLLFGLAPLAVASAFPTRLVVEPDRLLVYNGLGRSVLARPDIDHFEWRRPPLFLGQATISAVTKRGRKLLLTATVAYHDRDRRQRAAYLQNWLSSDLDETPGVRAGKAYRRDTLVFLVGAPAVFGWWSANEHLTPLAALAVGALAGAAALPLATRAVRFMSKHDIELLR